jgi:excisionase family DNA binding protein
MQTLDLDGAAGWLKCDPETVRAMAASGELPAAKVGRAWVFVDVDLVEWLRKQYGACHSTKTPPLGGKRPSP